MGLPERHQERSGLERAASTANMVHGAVKTGKAIAAAAKGASVGGPYGAVAGAVWGAGKHVGKIVAAILALLMLPVLYILMLPSLIFGNLSGGGSSAPAGSSAQPILNDSSAITANINTIAFTINQVLGEGIIDVETRIAQDFAGIGGYGYEIVNPYETSPVSNINSFLGQYCAAKGGDWSAISLADLEQVLRQGKSNLYTYTRAPEQRVVAADDPNTPNVVEQMTVTVQVYTIAYNGEAYFADTVFYLTDEQKALADDYAQNLSLFLGVQGVFSEEAVNGIAALGDVRFTDGATEVVYYNQLDERYCNKPYGTDHIGGYGCGPTAMAIVVSSLAGQTVDPVAMSAWAYENGYWCSRSGSYHALIPGAGHKAPADLLRDRRPSEIGPIGDAYQNLGWIEVEIVPHEYIIFEWQLDTYPRYPDLAYLR